VPELTDDERHALRNPAAPLSPEMERALREHPSRNAAGRMCECGKALRNAITENPYRRFEIEAKPDPDGEWAVMGWQVPAVMVPAEQLPGEPRFREHTHG
jgi:hypothetical protein